MSLENISTTVGWVPYYICVRDCHGCGRNLSSIDYPLVENTIKCLKYFMVSLEKYVNLSESIVTFIYRSFKNEWPHFTVKARKTMAKQSSLLVWPYLTVFLLKCKPNNSRWTIFRKKSTHSCSQYVYLPFLSIFADLSILKGHDTTAAAVNFCCYLVGCHPDVQAKIHAEMNAIFGSLCLRPLDQIQKDFLYIIYR